MARTPKELPTEADIKTSIVDECDRALKKLSVKPVLMSRTERIGPVELYEALRKHGAKSDAENHRELA